jgi:hypothetical protein
MINSLQEILFKYFLDNKLEDIINPHHFLYNFYLNWKDKNYIECNCCQILFKRQYCCEICQKYYYCNRCWDEYSYYCFKCNKNHCFVCNHKMTSCGICYRENRYN